MRWPKKTAEKRKLRYSRTRAAQYRCWIRTDVALADLLRDLDVRTVDGADEQAAVQAELHVGRSRCLSTSRRDVLTDIRSRDEDLGEGNGIIRQEEEAKEVLGLGIVVDDACNIDDEFDGQLSNVI